MDPYLSMQFKPERLTVDLPQGTKLSDRFIIRGLLGRGRWGEVLLAEDASRSVSVALKLAVVGPIQSDETIFRYRREAYFSSRLPDFRYVIQVFDLNETPWQGVSLLFLSMEYAAGGSLRAWLNRNHGDWETRKSKGLEYCLQASRGVMSAHSAGIVNLDIKPDNLLFVAEQLKATDFGSAHIKGRYEGTRPPQNANNPWVEGTPAYMSPEHFIVSHPDELDARADIYSLGVVIYEALSPACKPPFTGSLEQIKQGHLNVIPSTLKGIDSKLSSIVARCLEKDSADRFQTVEELITEIVACTKSKSFGTKKDNSHRTPSHDGKWKEASQLYRSGKLSQAATLLDEILANKPNQAQAENLRNDIRAKYTQADELYREAERLAENGLLKQGVTMLSSAAELYPEHPNGVSALTKLEAMSARYAFCMESLIKAIRDGRWASAVALLQEARAINRETPNASDLLETIGRIQEARRSMDTALLQGDHSRAIKMANLADALAGELANRLPFLFG